MAPTAAGTLADTPAAERLRHWHQHRHTAKMPPSCGAVAQLGERCVRNAEVGSSILLRSTIRLKQLGHLWQVAFFVVSDGCHKRITL